MVGSAPHPGGEEKAVSHRLAWDSDRIHQAVLAGLLSHVGMQEVTEVRVGGPAAGKRAADGKGRPARKVSRNEYLGARGARFAIFPGSPLSKKPPAWVMAGELVETSRLWARDVARIDPAWAEELAPHLVKRTYSDPAWSAKQGAAMASERVLLYGVPIVAQRRVLYAKVDPEHARELFIRHALVQGEWTTHHAFFHDNRRLLAEAEQLEHRARRRGLVADDDALYDFYAARIPADVVSARHFDQWWKGARRERPDLLTFTLDLLLADDAVAVDEARFPSVWPQGDLELPVTYQFQPGTEADGVTVHVPLPVLNRVRPEGFDWLVPGMLEDLATATVRSLPKPVRVQLVPAPDVGREVAGWIEANLPAWPDIVRAADMAPSFQDAFTRAVRALRGVEVPDDAWDADRLPSHLRVTFRVHDERGASSLLVDQGPDLVALQRRLAAQSQQAVRSAVRDAVRDAVRGAGRGAGSDGVPADAASTDRRAGVETQDPGWSEGGRHAGASGADRLTDRPAAPRAPNGAGAGEPGGTPAGLAEQEGLRTWPDGMPDGVLPPVVSVVAGGHTVQGFPALVAEPTGATRSGAARPGAATTSRGGVRPVALRVLADPVTAAIRHGEGVRELLLGELALATGRVTSRWPTAQALTLAASPYSSTEALVTDLQRAAADVLVEEHTGGRGARDVRDRDTYEQLRTALRDRLEDRTARVAQDAAAVLTVAREVDAALRATSSLAVLGTVTDVRGQLARLVHDGFVAETGAARLPHLVRYGRAALHRLAKAAENPARDEGLAWQVQELQTAYEEAVAAAARSAPDADRAARLAEVRWMIEELRVSLFAQGLGTAHPVSPKRVRAALSA